MNTCNAPHKKQAKAGERELTMEVINKSLANAGVGSKCGGAIEEVLSADGTKVYGERCARCGKSTVRCQVCGRLFANIGRHLEDKDGNPTDCYAGNQEYRRARAVKERMDSLGAVR
jgi:hypothetical protein